MLAALVLLILAAAGVVTIVGLCCLVVAGDADEAIERAADPAWWGAE